MRALYDFIKEGKKYFIYGKARLGRFCCEKICEKLGDDAVIGYIETKPNSKLFDGGKKIYSPEEVSGMVDENTCVVVTGRKSVEKMKRKCIEIGIKEENLFMPHVFLKYLETGFETQIRKVCIWPFIHTFNADLSEKIAWYIPERITVNLWTDDKQMIENFRDNVNVCSAEDTERIMQEADYILVWNIEEEDGVFDKHPEKCRSIDSHFFDMIDTYNYERILASSYSAEEKVELIEESKAVFKKFRESGKQKRGNVFCSGPSIAEVYDMPKETFNGHYNIICNSMVKDKELCSMLEPKAITFADTNFFFSPSEYGKAFYRDLLEAYEKYHFYIFVRDSQKILLNTHFPQLRERTIGLPYAAHPYYWFMDEEHFEVNPLSNILTEMMIPLASVVCDEVGIAGCTGRNPDETYFWEHNGRTQYLDLKESVFKMWPAFFKYRRYSAYYDKHCQIVEELLEYGESLGKKYINMTTSYIPALKKRE